MDIKIEQQGEGVLPITPIQDKEGEVTSQFQIQGEGCLATFTPYPGIGFTAWDSVYKIGNKPVVLKATGNDMSAELRVAMKDVIHGTWDSIEQPVLEKGFYQMAYTPFTKTYARFEANKVYRTFDIHFEMAYLEKFANNYAFFDDFLNKVKGSAPVVLENAIRRWSTFMRQSIDHILYNGFSSRAFASVLDNNIENILISVLEPIILTESKAEVLDATKLARINKAKALIEESFPERIDNKTLCQLTYLNETTLNYGFRKVLGVTARRYYHEIRLQKATQLLRGDEPIYAIAATLAYESDRAFSRAFRARYSMSPTEYRMMNR